MLSKVIKEITGAVVKIRKVIIIYLSYHIIILINSNNSKRRGLVPGYLPPKVPWAVTYLKFYHQNPHQTPPNR